MSFIPATIIIIRDAGKALLHKRGIILRHGCLVLLLRVAGTYPFPNIDGSVSHGFVFLVHLLVHGVRRLGVWGLSPVPWCRLVCLLYLLKIFLSHRVEALNDVLGAEARSLCETLSPRRSRSCLCI